MAFWQVVEVENVGMVATVAHVIGEDCAQYLPTDKQMPVLEFGNYKITLVTEKRHDTYLIER